MFVSPQQLHRVWSLASGNSLIANLSACLEQQEEKLILKPHSNRWLKEAVNSPGYVGQLE